MPCWATPSGKRNWHLPFWASCGNQILQDTHSPCLLVCTAVWPNSRRKWASSMTKMPTCTPLGRPGKNRFVFVLSWCSFWVEKDKNNHSRKTVDNNSPRLTSTPLPSIFFRPQQKSSGLLIFFNFKDERVVLLSGFPGHCKDAFSFWSLHKCQTFLGEHT